MTNTTATGMVKVKVLPKGQAPYQIRAAWVGLILPCYPFADLIKGFELGVLSGNPEKRSPRYCVLVPQAEALDILEEKSPRAAKWWRDQGFPRLLTPNFSFGEDEVEILCGVTRAQIIEVTDEMMGDPCR